MDDSGRYVGVAVGEDGAFGSIVSPESALISLRRIVRPAPLVGLKKSFSAAVSTDDDAPMIVSAWPKPSEAPKPVIV